MTKTQTYNAAMRMTDALWVTDLCDHMYKMHVVDDTSDVVAVKLSENHITFALSLDLRIPVNKGKEIVYRPLIVQTTLPAECGCDIDVFEVDSHELFDILDEMAESGCDEAMFSYEPSELNLVGGMLRVGEKYVQAYEKSMGEFLDEDGKKMPVVRHDLTEHTALYYSPATTKEKSEKALLTSVFAPVSEHERPYEETQQKEDNFMTNDDSLAQCVMCDGEGEIDGKNCTGCDGTGFRKNSKAYFKALENMSKPAGGEDDEEKPKAPEKKTTRRRAAKKNDVPEEAPVPEQETPGKQENAAEEPPFTPDEEPPAEEPPAEEPPAEEPPAEKPARRRRRTKEEKLADSIEEAKALLSDNGYTVSETVQKTKNETPDELLDTVAEMAQHINHLTGVLRKSITLTPVDAEELAHLIEEGVRKNVMDALGMSF